MKKILLTVALVAAATAAPAQVGFRLNGYSAYVFDDNYDVYDDSYYYYDGTVKGGYQWGVGAEILPDENYSVEVSYFNQKTNAPSTFREGVNNPVRYEDFNVGLNYILIGGNGIKSFGIVEGYGGLMAGVVVVNVEAPSTGGSASGTSFAWGGKFGVNIWATERLGIKLQAQLLSSTRATGGDLYYSYWGPVVLTTYSTLWQFGLGGGLTIKIL